MSPKDIGFGMMARSGTELSSRVKSYSNSDGDTSVDPRIPDSTCLSPNLLLYLSEKEVFMTRLRTILPLIILLITLGMQSPAQEAPAALLAQFDTDFSRRVISFDEILSGGPPKDGIPSIDNPGFVRVESAAEWLSPREPVIAVRNKDTTKIYPLQILTYHEIVNDEIGGIPVAVTFCPLCNTGIAFYREATVPRAVRDEAGGDTLVLDFGTTGRLRFSNLLMYDRQTESWWQQATGEAVMGLFTGETLRLYPAVTLSWKEASATYPDARVLSKETGYERPYGRNPYAGYDEGSPWAYRGPAPPEERDLMDRMVEVSYRGDSELYPYTQLQEERIIRDTLGGRPVVVFWHPGTASALDAADIAEGRDVGTANAFSPVLTIPDEGRTELEFRVRRGEIVDRKTRSVWNSAGRAVSGPLEGLELVPIPATDHFWFSAWAFADDPAAGREVAPPPPQ
jgi:hypothetical protein